MEFLADFHVHSRYSRATSRDLSLEALHLSALSKGIAVVGTGDFTHPGWFSEIREKLEPSGDGLFRMRADLTASLEKKAPPSCRGRVDFVLAAEVSNIYKKGGQVRKVHNLVLVPSLESAGRIAARLEKIGNIASDGRPILGLDSKDLLALVLEVEPQAVFIPAHIWTPWFSVLGSRSGFDSIEECFEDLSAEIFALETGLSADPAMCGRLSGLDRYTLVSNSDAHSAEKLGREANVFCCDLSYPAMREAMRSGRGRKFLGTVEFFPEQGKYHLDGHRKCGTRMEPAETLAAGGRCRVCGKEVTVGVMHRVELLADRTAGEKPPGALPYDRLVSLAEVLAEVHGTGPGSAYVRRTTDWLVERLGPELFILRRASLEEIERAAGALAAEAIRRMRAGEVEVEAGYDGEFGVVRLFRQGEIEDLSGAGLWAEETAKSACGEEEGEAKEEREGRAGQVLSGPIRPRPREKPAPLMSEERESGNDRGFSFEPLSSATEMFRATGGRILERLNSEQREAVLWRGSPLLVVAGPGTGKTFTLACRAAWLVREAGLPTERILAVTFTLKAAREMEERVRALLELEAQGSQGTVRVRTFHALGAELLREDLPWSGVPRGFSILEPSEQEAALRRACPGLAQSRCAELLERISLQKRGLRYPGDSPHDIRDPEFEGIYAAYQKEISAAGRLDFDDLVSLPARALSTSAGLREEIQGRFSAILVDEYQDLNLAQYRFLRLLAGPNREICAIGDPDQAIYGFRGASPEFFRRFLEDWPDGKIVRLVRNYRSSEPILTAATRMLEVGAGPEVERPGALIPAEPAGSRVRIVETPNEKSEAIFVAQTIERLMGGTDSLSFYSDRVHEAERFACGGFGEIAVLFRLSAQSSLIEEALRHQGIPYQSSARADTWQSPEGRALLAILRWIARRDEPSALEPARALFGRRINRVLKNLRDVAARESCSTVWTGGAGERRLHELRELLGEPERGGPGWREAWDALLGLAALEPGPDWDGLLRAVTLSQEADLLLPKSQKVTLATLHASKGLEFPVVFIVGCEADLLPLGLGRRQSDPEEERRLFYVGMTRARRLLYLVRSRTRLLFGRRKETAPSPFLLELPADKTETVSWLARPEGRKRKDRGAEDTQPSLFAMGDEVRDRK